jgi:hypothetical protein
MSAVLLSVTNPSGILISEAGFTGAEPVHRGCVFIDQIGMRTAVAFANPNPADATATLTLSDQNGQQIAQKVQTLRARTQLARYLTEIFPISLDGFRGSLGNLEREKRLDLFQNFKLSEQHQVFNSLSDKLSVTCGRPSFSAGVLLEQLCCVHEAKSDAASGL